MDTFARWKDNGDFDWDVAIVRLDRPLGEREGWFGLTTEASEGEIITVRGYGNTK